MAVAKEKQKSSISSDEKDYEYPFRVESFRRVVDTLQLPKYFAKILNITNSTCAQLQSSTPFRHAGSNGRLKYVFKIGIMGEDYFSLALSYDPESNITYGMLVCQTHSVGFHRLYYSEKKFRTHDRGRKSLWNVLQLYFELANHPLLIPVLLANTVIDLALKREFRAGVPIRREKKNFKDWRENLVEFEKETEDILRPSEKKLQNSFYESQWIIWRCRCHEHLLQATSKYIAALHSCDVGASTGFRVKETQQRQDLLAALERQSAHLEECIQNLQNTNRNLLAKTEFSRDIGTSTRDDYGTLISRTIAENTLEDGRIMKMLTNKTLDESKIMKDLTEATKRDSSSMKAIALLTMLFLPSTWVSTLLATPIFNWDSGPNSSPFLESGAWIYLVVTIPLTAVTLAIWALYMWTKSQPQDEAKTKIKITRSRIGQTFCFWRKNRARADDEEERDGQSGVSRPADEVEASSFPDGK